MFDIREEISLAHWPKTCQVGVIPIINCEVFINGHGGPCIQPHLSNLSPDIANNGWRDYGNKQGTNRLINIFSDLHIPFSIAMNSYIIDKETNLFDDILKYCEKEKDNIDIIGHGLTNSLSAVKHLSFEEQVKQSLNQIEIAFGKERRPKSWLSPGFAVTENSSKILVDNGICMSLDATNDDILYKENELIILPYSMETNDISLCMCQGYSGQQYSQILIDYVEQLSLETKSKPKVICFGLHTFIVGTPEKSFHLKKALQTIKQMSNVSFFNCHQLIKLL